MRVELEDMVTSTISSRRGQISIIVHTQHKEGGVKTCSSIKEDSYQLDLSQSDIRHIEAPEKELAVSISKNGWKRDGITAWIVCFAG